jgi:hypothetical protein
LQDDVERRCFASYRFFARRPSDDDRLPVNPTGVHFGLERAGVFFNVALLNKRAVHARYA